MATVKDHAHWLRSLDDSALTRLLESRPDALRPLPRNLPVVAERLNREGSLQLIGEKLSALELLCAEAAGDLGAAVAPVPLQAVRERVRSGTAEELADAPIHAALDTLRQVGVMYGSDDALRVVSNYRFLTPPNWSLLDAHTSPTASAAGAREVLATLSSEELEQLERLIRRPAVYPEKRRSAFEPSDAVLQRFIKNGLLRPFEAGVYRVPHGVIQALRGNNCPLPQLTLPAQWLPDTAPEQAAAAPPTDDEAVSAGLEAVRQMTLLLRALSREPLPTLRTGGVGVRALRTLSKQLGLPTERLSLLIHLAVRAELLGVDEPEPLPPGDADAYLAPVADHAAEWLDSSLAARWAMLLRAWWRNDFCAWEISSQSPAVHDSLVRSALPDTRAWVIAVMSGAHSAITREALLAALSTARPLSFVHSSPALLDHLLAEATFVGAVVGLQVSQPGQAVARGEDPGEVTAALVPPEVAQVVVQSDLTILVPGPPSAALSLVLSEIADLESPGLASVYRITEDTVERALNAGLDSEDLVEFFTAHAIGTLPDTVPYLIRDVARRHGTLRAGAMASYLRATDPALLAQVCASPKVKKLALRQLAPTVAVSPLPLKKVLTTLRAAGFQPTAENADGALVTDAMTSYSVAPPLRPYRLQAPNAASVVTHLRGTASTSDSDDDVTAALHRALAAGTTVRIAVRTPHGQLRYDVVKPQELRDGHFYGLVRGGAGTMRYDLNRITAVQLY